MPAVVISIRKGKLGLLMLVGVSQHKPTHNQRFNPGYKKNAGTNRMQFDL